MYFIICNTLYYRAKYGHNLLILASMKLNFSTQTLLINIQNYITQVNILLHQDTLVIKCPQAIDYDGDLNLDILFYSKLKQQQTTPSYRI